MSEFHIHVVQVGEISPHPGFVMKPVRERWDDRVGRVILKLHGEAYLLRK